MRAWRHHLSQRVHPLQILTNSSFHPFNNGSNNNSHNATIIRIQKLDRGQERHKCVFYSHRWASAKNRFLLLGLYRIIIIIIIIIISGSSTSSNISFCSSSNSSSNSSSSSSRRRRRRLLVVVVVIVT